MPQSQVEPGSYLCRCEGLAAVESGVADEASEGRMQLRAPKHHVTDVVVKVLDVIRPQTKSATSSSDVIRPQTEAATSKYWTSSGLRLSQQHQSIDIIRPQTESATLKYLLDIIRSHVAAFLSKEAFIRRKPYSENFLLKSFITIWLCLALEAK